MIVSDDAIIIHSRKFGDSSKITEIFSRSYGRVSVVAKGARKPKSKFGGSLEPLSVVRIVFYFKPNTDLFTLSGCEHLHSYFRLRSSFEHSATGLLLAESVLLTQEKKSPNEELFNSFLAHLDFLNSIPENPFNAFIYFQLELAVSLGFGIDFVYKKGNGDAIVEFSLENGSYNSNTTGNFRNHFRFNIATFELLKKISEISISELPQIEIEKKEKLQIVNFFKQYFSFHLERKIDYETLKLFF